MAVKISRAIIMILSLVFFLTVTNASTQIDRIAQQNQDDVISSKVDSIKGKLKMDTTSSVLMFFNADYSNANLYGCVVYKKGSHFEGVKIKYLQNKAYSAKLRGSALEANEQLLKRFFEKPDEFLDSFPPRKSRQISHDNNIYFFAKEQGNILFDGKFKRSNSMATNNPKISRLIMELGALGD